MKKQEKPIVSINLEYILRECCPEKTRDEVKNYLIEQNREMLHQAFGYQKRNHSDYFACYLTLYKSDDNTSYSLRSSYSEFVNRLTIILNCQNPENLPIINSLLDVRFANSLEELKRVKTEEELKEKFPHIYDDFYRGREKLRELEERKTKEGNTAEIKELEHQYYAWGIRKGFKNFITTQVKMYERYALEREKYKELVLDNDYNEFIRENLDQERLFLLVNNTLLNTFESSAYNRKTMEAYFHPVELSLAYYKINPAITIIDDNDQEVSYNSLKQRLKDIRQNIGLTTNLLEWVLVPEKPLDLDTVKAQKKARSQKMTPSRYKELQRRGMMRQQFYERSNCQRKLQGVLKDHGYAAYIFPNGQVMLDREYNETAVSSASGNASFLVPAKDFLELSKMDKQELRSNPKVKAFNHNDTWEQRVSKYLDQQGTIEEQEEAKILIKKIKEGKY